MRLGDSGFTHLSRPAQEDHLPEIQQALHHYFIINSRFHGAIVPKSPPENNYQSGIYSVLVITKAEYTPFW
jgi:hypothetical protein